MNNQRLPHSNIGLIPREAITAHQINTLLGVVHSLTEYLAQPNVDQANPHRGSRTDGGARDSAEVTFMSACDRLDNIIKDDNRWSMVVQNALEARTLELLDANVEFLRAQTAASRSLTRPAFQHSPQLLKLSTGSWVAILGDHKKPEACVIGVGDSPEAALKDFDSAFAGVTTPEARAWLEAQSVLQEPKTPTRKKKS